MLYLHISLLLFVLLLGLLTFVAYVTMKEKYNWYDDTIIRIANIGIIIDVIFMVIFTIILPVYADKKAEVIKTEAQLIYSTKENSDFITVETVDGDKISVRLDDIDIEFGDTNEVFIKSPHRCTPMIVKIQLTDDVANTLGIAKIE